MNSLPLLTCVLVLGAAPSSTGLVRVSDLIPDAVEDLRYATPDNFLGRKVYPDSARCLLLQRSATMLQKAADALRQKGYRLRLYDCYRPRRVQFEMWKIFPKPGYVADPKQGSNHNRGGAVDLSLVTLSGEPVEMPTPYDSFTRAAHHGYPGGTEASRRHRELLKRAMHEAGFKPNPMEWWHYDIPQPKQHPVLDIPFEEL